MPMIYIPKSLPPCDHDDCGPTGCKREVLPPSQECAVCGHRDALDVLKCDECGYDFPSPASPAVAFCSPSGGDVHADLIDRAAAWLQKKGCAVVITDMTHGGPETADAIGWKGNYATIIECKASRSDFLADRKKDFRRRPERGMGSLRYFCAPVGLIRTDELPPHWGLLESAKGKLREAVKATHQDANKKEEVGLLLSALRRIAHTAPKGVSVRCYTMTTKCRASLGVANTEGLASPAGSEL